LAVSLWAVTVVSGVHVVELRIAIVITITAFTAPTTPATSLTTFTTTIWTALGTGVSAVFTTCLTCIAFYSTFFAGNALGTLGGALLSIFLQGALRI
jgi:hypothetical protein